MSHQSFQRNTHRQIIAYIVTLTFFVNPLAWGGKEQLDPPANPPVNAQADTAPAAQVTERSTDVKLPKKSLDTVKSDQFTARFKGYPQYRFDFDQTRKKYDEWTKESEFYKDVKCTESTLDTATRAGVSLVSSGGSSHAQAQTGETGSAIAQANVIKFENDCKTDNEALLEKGEKVKSILAAEKSVCISEAAMTSANRFCSSVPAEPAHSTCVTEAKKYNTQQCSNVNITIEKETGAIMAFLKEHWGKLLLLTGALGAGLMTLNSSSDDAKNDFTTSPNSPTIPTQKKKNKDKDNNVPTPSPGTGMQVVSNQVPAYCRSSLQPLECLVTSGCDLKCVAEKYGVTDYAGMDKSTIRIDKNGHAVDATSAISGNPGSAGGLAGGGGGASGKANELGSSSGEVGSQQSGIATRGSLRYGDDDSFGGGGRGRFGDSSGRDPASDRYNPNNTLTASERAKRAEASGPIQPIGSNLFNSVNNVTRTQCVRDLVFCIW